MAGDGVRRVDDVALASRLSFFLWSSLPDAQLLQVAERGELHDRAVLEAQVKRMLADPRADALVTNFAFQWLNIGKLAEIEPDSRIFPYASGLSDPRADFREELRLYIGSILLTDRSVVDLLTADWTFLNERLALHYGITDVKGRSLPSRAARAERALRAAGQGRHPDADGVSQPHFAGAARPVDPGSPHGHAARAAAADGGIPQGEQGRRQAQDHP